jgi:hypothetical protein
MPVDESGRHISDDGQWMWDGQAWQPNPNPPQMPPPPAAEPPVADTPAESPGAPDAPVEPSPVAEAPLGDTTATAAFPAAAAAGYGADETMRMPAAYPPPAGGFPGGPVGPPVYQTAPGYPAYPPQRERPSWLIPAIAAAIVVLLGGGAAAFFLLKGDDKKKDDPVVTSSARPTGFVSGGPTAGPTSGPSDFPTVGPSGVPTPTFGSSFDPDAIAHEAALSRLRPNAGGGTSLRPGKYDCFQLSSTGENKGATGKNLEAGGNNEYDYDGESGSYTIEDGLEITWSGGSLDGAHGAWFTSSGNYGVFLDLDHATQGAIVCRMAG